MQVIIAQNRPETIIKLPYRTSLYVFRENYDKKWDKTNRLQLDSSDQTDLAVGPRQAQRGLGQQETCHEDGSALQNTLPHRVSHQSQHRHRGFETDG